jgi:hypothetical protein
MAMAVLLKDWLVSNKIIIHTFFSVHNTFRTTLSLGIIIVNFRSQEEIVLDYNCLLMLFSLFYKLLPAADVFSFMYLLFYFFICSLFNVTVILSCCVVLSGLTLVNMNWKRCRRDGYGLAS